MKQEGGGGLRVRVHRLKSRALEALLLVVANSFIYAWYYCCCILWNNFLGNRVSDKSCLRGNQYQHGCGKRWWIHTCYLSW